MGHETFDAVFKLLSQSPAPSPRFLCRLTRVSRDIHLISSHTSPKSRYMLMCIFVSSGDDIRARAAITLPMRVVYTSSFASSTASSSHPGTLQTFQCTMHSIRASLIVDGHTDFIALTVRRNRHAAGDALSCVWADTGESERWQPRSG
jgi:hypothetical protein